MTKIPLDLEPSAVESGEVTDESRASCLMNEKRKVYSQDRKHLEVSCVELATMHVHFCGHHFKVCALVPGIEVKSQGFGISSKRWNQPQSPWKVWLTFSRMNFLFVKWNKNPYLTSIFQGFKEITVKCFVCHYREVMVAVYIIHSDLFLCALFHCVF